MIYSLLSIILTVSNLILIITAIIIVEYLRRTVKTIAIDILEIISRIDALAHDKQARQQRLELEIDNAKQQLSDHRLMLRAGYIPTKFIPAEHDIEVSDNAVST